MKNYLLELLHLCSDERFGQDAVEWAIVSGYVQLQYELEKDLRLIMGEPGRPETGAYDRIVEAYGRWCQQENESRLESQAILLECEVA